MATVTLVDVTKVFDNGSHVTHDLSLDIAESEFLVLVGPSGSGKSTVFADGRRAGVDHQR